MYEISHPQYRRFIMIKHIGIPLHYGNGKLMTPHKIVWWWPMNWFVPSYYMIKYFIGKAFKN